MMAALWLPIGRTRYKKQDPSPGIQSNFHEGNGPEHSHACEIWRHRALDTSVVNAHEWRW